MDAVTREDSPAWMPLADRIAVVDNDGTRWPWPENPMVAQLDFILRILSVAALFAVRRR